MKDIRDYAPPLHPLWRLLIFAIIGVTGTMVYNHVHAAPFDEIKYSFVEQGDSRLGRPKPGVIIHGAYWPDSHNIYIAESDDEELIEHTVFHEKAHYVWYNFLTENERDYYCFNLVMEGAGVSAYSMLSCEENFADNFAYYMGSRWRCTSFAGLVMEGTTQKKIISEMIERFTDA